MVNDFSVNYNNGLVDNPHYVNISGNGVYQYSLPMCMLLRGITETVSEVPNAADYFSWREREWKKQTVTNALRLVNYDRFFFMLLYVNINTTIQTVLQIYMHTE